MYFTACLIELDDVQVADLVVNEHLDCLGGGGEGRGGGRAGRGSTGKDHEAFYEIGEDGGVGQYHGHKVGQKGEGGGGRRE